MSLGGQDLFGPNAHHVHEWHKDTEEEQVKMISYVFEECEQCDKAARKKTTASSTSWRPLWSLAHPSPLDSLHLHLKTLTNALWASLFVGTEASSFHTRPVLHHQTKDSLSIRTKSLLPNNLVTAVTTSPLDRTPIAETRISPPSKVALSSRKGGVEEEIIKDNRTECGEEAFTLPDQMV